MLSSLGRLTTTYMNMASCNSDAVEIAAALRHECEQLLPGLSEQDQGVVIATVVERCERMLDPVPSSATVVRFPGRQERSTGGAFGQRRQ